MQEDPRQRRSSIETQEERRQIARRNSAVVRAINLIYFPVGALEILLVLRFFLRLTGANPENQFASVIYTLSRPFIVPFSTLFISPEAGGGKVIFDINILVAIVSYALLGWLLGRLIWIVWGSTR